ncbi:uncharacterized protein K452DRAFT_159487 [Aplosporella prunicola CBS 121167]|uniref:Transmembrane protein n=1 Tax=Aplosporella prunicola CBS 121167 TaxID=1176127 RepID=A0A6A6BJL9_9PEZI|nr:uncharacterized protein K452DRAFT_159487 [Aplosporella prunicola CBS 121167]KAF2143573.1 hypothetical protein K452DRAFT_159487 [Aplosporella prunicola CBS 121167]
MGRRRHEVLSQDQAVQCAAARCFVLFLFLFVSCRCFFLSFHLSSRHFSSSFSFLISSFFIFFFFLLLLYGLLSPFALFCPSASLSGCRNEPARGFGQAVAVSVSSRAEAVKQSRYLQTRSSSRHVPTYTCLRPRLSSSAVAPAFLCFCCSASHTRANASLGAFLLPPSSCCFYLTWLGFDVAFNFNFASLLAGLWALGLGTWCFFLDAWMHAWMGGLLYVCRWLG